MGLGGGLSQHGQCQQACCPHGPVSCHQLAVAFPGPFGLRDRWIQGAERHEPSEQDPWFGDVGRHVSWHGEEGCRKGRASPKSQTAPQSSREAAAEGPQSCVLLLCQRQLPAGAGPQGLDVSPGLAGDAHIPAGAALDFPLHASTPRLGFPWGSSQVLGVGRCCLPPRWAPGTPARRSGRC